MRKLDFQRLVADSLLITPYLYLTSKDRISGEKDLERLVDREDKEGAWLFLPEVKHWLYISVDSFETDSSYETRVEMFPIKKRLNVNLASQYHIHPKSFEKKSYEIWIKDLPENLKISTIWDSYIKGIFQKATRINSVLPSKGDLDCYLAFLETNQDMSYLDFKISHPSGCTTIAFKNDHSSGDIVNRYNAVYKSIFTEIMDTAKAPSIEECFEKINAECGSNFTLSLEKRK